MKYEDFKKLLNKVIYSDGEENYSLLLKIIKEPHRYCGLFRLSNGRSKLLQNVTQSREIKFGDFLEYLVTEYFSLCNYDNLSKDLGYDEKRKRLLVDQIFIKNNELYFIEQKVRDDHDSTKKEGQFRNFIKKYERIKEKYPNIKIHGIMWFIDSSLSKNERYYSREISDHSDKNLKLFYGNQLFDYLNIPYVWEELINHLQTIRDGNNEEIIDIPDFDTSEEIYEELVKLPKNLWDKLNSNEEIYKILRAEIFPTEYNLERAGIARDLKRKKKL
ncbi:MAG TPA: restriction endonuclease [Gallicola sp.]|nr:restriction endonuclease [Gallicola sp.]